MKIANSFAIVTSLAGVGVTQAATVRGAARNEQDPRALGVICPAVYRPVICGTERHSNMCVATVAGYREEDCVRDEYEDIVNLMNDEFDYNCQTITPRTQPEDAQTWTVCNAPSVEAKLVASGLEFPTPVSLQTIYTDEEAGSATAMILFDNDGTGLEQAEDMLDGLVEPRDSQDICSLPAESGPCYAYMPSFYYNAEAGRCEEFIYGGCEGNANNFATLADCEDSCLVDDDIEDDQPPVEAAGGDSAGTLPDGGRALSLPEDDDEEDVCSLPPIQGPCKAAFHRFYFDEVTGTCKPFIYGGCQGNGNNFDTLADCEGTCAM